MTLGPAAPPLLAPPGTLVTLRRALSFSLSVHPFKRKSMKPGPPANPTPALPSFPADAALRYQLVRLDSSTPGLAMLSPGLAVWHAGHGA